MFLALGLAIPALTGAADDRSDLQGFASPEQNLFHPLLRLGLSGHPLTALHTFHTIMAFERKLTLHPALSPELQSLVDKLPPPETIMIELPALYSDSTIPWQTRPPDTRYLAVMGRPDASDYVYSLSPITDPRDEPGLAAGTISIRPVHPKDQAASESVIAEVQGSLHPPGPSVPSQGMAAWADLMREIYGSLASPWDTTLGQFNEHDRAAMARFARDMPALSGLVSHYLEIHNVLDEFDDRSGPWVTFNLDANIRDDALVPFPYLHDFYRQLWSRLELRWMVTDDTGHEWLRVGLNRGRITVTFIVRRGMLTPMDQATRPAGPPCPLDQIIEGRFTTEASVAQERLGLRFGLAAIRYSTVYSNRDGTVEFHSRMSAVPRLIAPPIVHGLTMLLAGQFMETLARGNSGRGIATSFSASPTPNGGTILHGTFSAEFRQAPALAMLMRLAGAITPAHDAEVRADERRLAAQFFDALASDLDRARPSLVGDDSALR